MRLKKFLFVILLSLLSLQVFAGSITVNGRTINTDDAKALADKIQSGDIDPSQISNEDFNSLTPTQQSQIIDKYNERTGNTFTNAQFQEEINNTVESNTSSSDQIIDEVANNNPSIRDAINDPANANTDELKENANLTDQQIADIQKAQEKLKLQQIETEKRAAELEAHNKTILETQDQINNLNQNADNLNSRNEEIQNQITNSSSQINNLEKAAQEAQAAGDLAAFQENQDKIDELKRTELASKNELIQVAITQAKLKEEIKVKEDLLKKQQRLKEIESAELASSKKEEEDLTADILQNVADAVVEQPVTSIVNGEEDENSDDNTPTVGDILNIVQEEEEKGNITLDDNGNLQVNQEAIVQNQNEQNSKGYCLEDGICISNERAVSGLACHIKPEAEKEACLSEVSKGVTRDMIEGGEGCKNNIGEDAKACREAGRTFNCEYRQCLSDDDVNELADAGAACMAKGSSDDKKACFNDVKKTAVSNAAKGNYCEKDGEEAKQCESGGGNWNCNINFCATDLQNQAISDAVVDCQDKNTKGERDHCMDGLKENGAYIMASACEEAQSPKGLQCSEDGNVWNCGANACVTPDMNGRLVEAFKSCQSKSSEEEKKVCMDELGTLAAAASENKKVTEDDFKNPGSPATIAYATVTAIGSLVAVLASETFCYAGAMNIMAGGMAIMSEKNSEKSAKQQLGNLKEQFKKLDEKLKKDVVSYEVQVEAITFYINALRTSEMIAETYATGYDQSGNTFGMAIGVAAIEAVVYAYSQNWAGVKCAGISGGSALVGMGLSNKAASAARGLASDFKSQREKLEKIKKLFDKHFGNAGGLTQALAYQNGYRGGISQINGNSSITSATGQSNVQAGEGDKLLVDTDHCLDSAGKSDEGCSCRDTNSCYEIKPPDLLTDTKIGRSVSSAMDMTSSFTEANSIASGQLSHTSFNAGKTAARFKRTRKVVKKLLGQVNKKLSKFKKGNTSFEYPTNKSLAAYVNRKVPSNTLVGGGAKFMGKLFGDVNPEDITKTEKALSKTISKDGSRIVASNNVTTPLGKFKMPKMDMSMDNLTIDEMDTLAIKKDQEIVNSEFNGNMEALGKLPDVHENTTLSLWNILTKRYHKITRQKRIGKFKSR